MRSYFLYPSTLLIFARADYADDEYIRDLLAWKHPYVMETGEFQYTEEEKMAMLNLPRKECEQLHLDFGQKLFI